MKKMLSILLCLVLIFGMTVPAFAAGDTNAYPVITIGGRDEDFAYVNAAGERIYPNDLDTTQIINEVKECLPLFAEALITDEYDEWVDRVTEIFAAYYDEMLPDKDGNITNGSHIAGWTKPVLTAAPTDDINRTDINNFFYDWRLSPLELADYLEEYIQKVKKSTGKEKVCLFGRCMGCDILSADLCKYGADELDTVVYGASTTMGAETVSAVFSGNIAVDADTLVQYITSQESLTGDAAIDALIDTLLAFLQSVYGLNATTELATILLKKVYPRLAPSLLRVSYAGYPGIWSLVSPDDYEKAKDFIFSGCKTEYAGLIEKTDAYFAVQEKIENELKQDHENGLKVAVFAKYNLPMIPVSADSTKQSDGTVLTAAASFGATCADAGKTLAKTVTKNVPAQYLSADGVIDSSTCLFPEQTWFIKDIGHSTYNSDFFTLLKLICHSTTEVTVNSYEAFPSFLQWNAEDNTLTPLNETDTVTASTPFSALKNIFVRLKNFVEALFAVLKKIGK